MEQKELSPDIAEKILDADFQNIVKKVAAGKPLCIPRLQGGGVELAARPEPK